LHRAKIGRHKTFGAHYLKVDVAFVDIFALWFQFIDC
jgi:hypothetical protein